MGGRAVFLGVALACLACVGAVSFATAAELTRSAYVARAELICGDTSTKAIPAFKIGVKQLKNNEVISAGTKLMEVARLNETSRGRLQKLPKPPEDSADLATWLAQLGAQNRLLRKAGKELHEEHRVQAQGYLSRFVHSGNVANDTVLGFGFKDCLFEGSLK
jgi:hypothetical protein